MTTGKNENLHVLRILDAVSRDGDLTQRSLSQRLGVALGLTNLYLKRLITKGYIKVVNIKPNRLRYELTPSGIAQKTTMGLQYVQESYRFYREARSGIAIRLWGLKRDGVRSVVFYGSGDLAEIAFLALQETGLELAGVIDSHGVGGSFCGRVVQDVGSIAVYQWDRIVVVDQNYAEIEAELVNLGISRSKIVSFAEAAT